MLKKWVLKCVWKTCLNIEGLLYKDLNELENLVLDIDAYITLDVGHAHNNKFTVAGYAQNFQNRTYSSFR